MEKIFDRSPKIAVSGDLGSGKSTVGKLLKEKLGFEIFSMGEAWRQLAAKYQMTILELNKYSESHPLDEEMDQMMATKGHAAVNLILDSRLAWHFVPDSFKVHLIVNSKIAAERIFNDQRGSAEGYQSVTEAYQKIRERKSSETLRYLHKYGLDCSRFENYDLIIETSYATPAEIVELITAKFQLWLQSADFTKVWLAPKSLFPTKTIIELKSNPDNLTNEPIAVNGFNEQLPIETLKVDCQFFIFKGHHRASAALKNRLNLIPTQIIGENSGQLADGTTIHTFVSHHCQHPIIKDWEQYHQFQFAEYPLGLK